MPFECTLFLEELGRFSCYLEDFYTNCVLHGGWHNVGDAPVPNEVHTG